MAEDVLIREDKNLFRSYLENYNLFYLKTVTKKSHNEYFGQLIYTVPEVYHHRLLAVLNKQ